MSVEQMARDLLTQAIKDGLVVQFDDCGDPQHMTSGELVGVANMLVGFLAAHGAKDSPTGTPETSK